MKTLLQQHRENWKDCTRCALSLVRNKVVLVRGTVPCDVFFIGEAPGKSENIIGDPFVGPAGHLQNRIMRKAFAAFPHLTYCLTNLVACIPFDEDRNKTVNPEATEILSCKPRLLELYGIAHPRLIVCVGKLARSWLDKVIPQKEQVPSVDITHPSAIMQAPYANQALMEQKNVVSLQAALEELEELES